MEKTYKIPEGAEKIVDNMVSVGVERFIAQQKLVIPKEATTEYETAVDAFRKDNKMEPKFSTL